MAKPQTRQEREDRRWLIYKLKALLAEIADALNSPAHLEHHMKEWRRGRQWETAPEEFRRLLTAQQLEVRELLDEAIAGREGCM